MTDEEGKTAETPAQKMAAQKMAAMVAAKKAAKGKVDLADARGPKGTQGPRGKMAVKRMAMPGRGGGR